MFLSTQANLDLNLGGKCQDASGEMEGIIAFDTFASHFLLYLCNCKLNHFKNFQF